MKHNDQKDLQRKQLKVSHTIINVGSVLEGPLQLSKLPAGNYKQYSTIIANIKIQIAE